MTKQERIDEMHEELHSCYEIIRKYQEALQRISNFDLEQIGSQSFTYLKQIATKALEGK